MPSTASNPRLKALVKGMRAFDAAAWSAYGGRCSPQAPRASISCAVIDEEAEFDDVAASVVSVNWEAMKKPAALKKKDSRTFAFDD